MRSDRHFAVRAHFFFALPSMTDEIPRWDVRRDPQLALIASAYFEAIRELGLDPDNPPPDLPGWEDLIGSEVLGSIPEIGQRLAERWRTRTVEELARRKVERAFFEERLHTTWGEALNGLEQLLIMSYEMGFNLHKRHTWRIGEPPDYWVDAVFSLHARGVLVGREILCLLRAGFAAGAEARWRTLHELSVVAAFIAKHGPETAERYLQHDHIAHFRSMQHFQKNCGTFGLEPYSTDEVEEARRNRDELIVEYGENYSSDYGWAAKALKPEKPKYEPSFADLEAAVELGPWRIAYAYASQSVHAGPRGFRDNLGNPDADRGAMQTEPSISGLIEPGARTMHSVLLLTRAVAARHPWIEDLTFLAAMNEVARNTALSFREAHQKEVAGRMAPGQAQEG